jgi:outer membrane protein TolC
MALSELSTALKVAREVPLEYEYNEMAYQAIQQRYSSGLIDYSVFIKAQYDLLQSETKLRIAYIDTWKSLLRIAFVKGNMDIFLNQIRN